MHLCCWHDVVFLVFLLKRTSWVKRQFWSGTTKPTSPKERAFSLNRWKSLLNGSRMQRKVRTSLSPFFLSCLSVFSVLPPTAKKKNMAWLCAVSHLCWIADRCIRHLFFLSRFQIKWHWWWCSVCVNVWAWCFSFPESESEEEEADWGTSSYNFHLDLCFYINTAPDAVEWIVTEVCLYLIFFLFYSLPPHI